MHEDGTTVVNTEDPTWELALAEVAKYTNRIVNNATLAAADCQLQVLQKQKQMLPS